MDPTLQTILTIFTPLITVIVAGVAGVAGVAMSRWQAREQVKTMQANSKLAVQAVEQMAYAKNLSSDDKAKMALSLAQTWNQSAKITVPDASVSMANEGHVLTLPPTNVPCGPTIDDEPKG
jgi:hypothetical protein